MLIVLLIALIAAAALAWHYRDYLRAFANSRKYSSEDLQQQLEDNQASLEEILSLYLPMEDEPNDLTPGASPEDVDSPKQEGTTSQPVSENTAQLETDEPAKVDPEITNIVAAFDALRSDYLARLEGLKNRAYSEYKEKSKVKSLSKKELVNFAAGFVREATVMEVECDNQVFALLTELEKTIKKNGGDSTLPDKILEYYLNEKQLTKAMYISELEKRGLIL